MFAEFHFKDGTREIIELKPMDLSALRSVLSPETVIEIRQEFPQHPAYNCSKNREPGPFLWVNQGVSGVIGESQLPWRY